ncbi:MAG: cyclic nucleotide-binding domain-containing protein [Cyclobacteriaceae bacterium]|nr:cyclic nucleotide-binding domain-containing protein [Cyclobacteriaceae bacterium]
MSIESNKGIARLKAVYFSDPTKFVSLKKGEVLLREDEHNEKLYLILDGEMAGYIKDASGEDFEVFRSEKDMFVGVYSFFSEDQKSFLTVRAEADTKVAYIEQHQKDSDPNFAAHFFPIIVHEIYLRQLLAQTMSRERQAAVKKLYETEKMATLGQLAAGIAHELNNAIGVLDRNTEWLANSLRDYLKSKELQHLFATNLEEGQTLSSASIRKKSRSFEEKYGVSPKLAKQLAKTSLSEVQLDSLVKKGLRDFEIIKLVTDAGIVLHDMKIAASHAAHVVRSVRELGNAQKTILVETSIHQTIREALTLTKNLVQDVNVVIHADTEGVLLANPGDFVQVWINLIKNACESMKLAQVNEPTLIFRISCDVAFYTVSITDNGTGIAAEIMDKIFQPSFTTKVNGLSFGLGLGLSIVKKIIGSYRGSIAVTSKPGETSFLVTLPKK